MKRRAGKRKVSEKTSKTEQGKYSSKYALSERLVCGECGSAYRRCTWTARGKRRIVWRCISRLDHGKAYCHASPTLSEEALQKAICCAINEFITQNAIKEAAKESSEIAVMGNSREGMSISKLQRDVSEITAEQEHLLEKILEDMDNPELNARMQALTDQKTSLIEDITQRKAEISRHEAELDRMKDIDAWIAEHPTGFLEYDETAVKRTIQRVTVISKTAVRIQFYSSSDEVTMELDV